MLTQSHYTNEELGAAYSLGGVVGFLSLDVHVGILHEVTKWHSEEI
jgi:hypothetical protein